MATKPVRPFVVRRNVTVVEGACLDSPWIVDSQTKSGDQFVQILKGDRNLSKALGSDMTCRRPLKKSTLFARMTEMRDPEIDRMISIKACADDPMATRTAHESVS